MALRTEGVADGGVFGSTGDGFDFPACECGEGVGEGAHVVEGETWAVEFEVLNEEREGGSVGGASEEGEESGGVGVTGGGDCDQNGIGTEVGGFVREALGFGGIIGGGSGNDGDATGGPGDDLCEDVAAFFPGEEGDFTGDGGDEKAIDLGGEGIVNESVEAVEIDLSANIEGGLEDGDDAGGESHDC